MKSFPTERNFDKIFEKVSHEVVAHPVFHHVAPVVHHAPLVHHAVAPVAHHVVDPVALTHGAVHQVTPFVNLGRKKREADAEVIICVTFKNNISPKFFLSQ